MSCFEISAKNGMCFNRELFNNYSSSLNGLWVNSSWGRRPNGLLTQRPRGQGE